MLNDQLQMQLKLLQKEQLKKQHKELVIWLVTKVLIILQKPKKKSPQNISEIVESEMKIPRERKERSQIINELILI